MRWRDSVIASITVIYLRKRIKIAPEATVGGRWRWLVTTAAWETASLVCCQERSAEPERNPNLCAPDEVINNRGQRRWRRLLCLSLSGKKSRRMRWVGGRMKERNGGCGESNWNVYFINGVVSSRVRWDGTAAGWGRHLPYECVRRQIEYIC